MLRADVAVQRDDRWSPADRAACAYQFWSERMVYILIRALPRYRLLIRVLYKALEFSIRSPSHCRLKIRTALSIHVGTNGSRRREHCGRRQRGAAEQLIVGD